MIAYVCGNGVLRLGDTRSVVDRRLHAVQSAINGHVALGTEALSIGSERKSRQGHGRGHGGTLSTSMLFERTERGIVTSGRRVTACAQAQTQAVMRSHDGEGRDFGIRHVARVPGGSCETCEGGLMQLKHVCLKVHGAPWLDHGRNVSKKARCHNPVTTQNTNAAVMDGGGSSKAMTRRA